MYRVYLAGPITGCTYEGCTSWREFAKYALAKNDIVGLDPMRAKDYLANEKCISNDYDTPLSCARGIMTRDHWDCIRSDVVLVNLIGATKVSIGTIMEVAWAWDNDVPVVLVMEENNIHSHAMLNEATGFRVFTLEAGLEIVKAILSQ